VNTPALGDHILTCLINYNIIVVIVGAFRVLCLLSLMQLLVV